MLLSNDDNMANDCPYEHKNRAYIVEVIIANKAEINDELCYRNSMYNLHLFNVNILDSGCTRHKLSHMCYILTFTL